MDRVPRVAVLDLYDGEPNEGMRCIRELLEDADRSIGQPLAYTIFDVRGKNEVPDLSYDAYISSGGPGSPLDSEGTEWEHKFFGLMDALFAHNAANPGQRKHVLLICHSFQLYCRHYGFAKVSKRKSTAFGVMPVHLTSAGGSDVLLRTLPEPFYAVDSRDYQVTEPQLEKISARGGHVLCLEKERPHIALPRAIMAIRFDQAFVGTQFHPEADAEGMYRYLIRDDKRSAVVSRFGERKYSEMLQNLNDPDKIRHTYHSIVPAFLANACLTVTPRTV